MKAYVMRHKQRFKVILHVFNKLVSRNVIVLMSLVLRDLETLVTVISCNIFLLDKRLWIRKDVDKRSFSGDTKPKLLILW